VNNILSLFLSAGVINGGGFPACVGRTDGRADTGCGLLVAKVKDQLARSDLVGRPTFVTWRAGGLVWPSSPPLDKPSHFTLAAVVI